MRAALSTVNLREPPTAAVAKRNRPLRAPQISLAPEQCYYPARSKLNRIQS